MVAANDPALLSLGPLWQTSLINIGDEIWKADDSLDKETIALVFPTARYP